MKIFCYVFIFPNTCSYSIKFSFHPPNFPLNLTRHKSHSKSTMKQNLDQFLLKERCQCFDPELSTSWIQTCHVMFCSLSIKLVKWRVEFSRTTNLKQPCPDADAASAQNQNKREEGVVFFQIHGIRKSKQIEYL